MSSRWKRHSDWRYYSPPSPIASGSLLNDCGAEHHGGPLLVPGFNGLPVNVQLMPEDRYAHGFDDWAQARLTAREVAMLEIMNDITDGEGWEDAVFDDAIVAWWHKELAATRRLFSDATWDWCVAELRDAARVFRDTRCVDVLHSASGVCKSDGLVSSGTLDALRAGVAALMDDKDDLASHPFFPNRHDLVDPTLYLLAYGATPAVFHGDVEVSLEDIFDSLKSQYAARRGQPAPQTIEGRKDPPPDWMLDPQRLWRSLAEPEKWLWSPDFQLLPCDVDFTKDGTGVTISSYINNLHPERHPTVYRAVESVLAAAIPMWNRVLVKREMDRLPPRIRTYGAVTEPQGPPPWRDYAISVEKAHHPDRPHPVYAAVQQKVQEYLAEPEPPLLDMLNPHFHGEEGFLGDTFAAAIDQKFTRLERAVHPEPGTMYTYEDWKAGKANRPIVPGIYDDNEDTPRPHQQNAKLGDSAGEIGGGRPFVVEHADHVHTPPVDLATSFSTKGLQVIVKLSRTTLDPQETPHCGAEDWRVDGTMNEHVVAGAVLVLDSHNVTTPAMDFRVEADLDQTEFGYRDDPELRAIEITFGLDKPGSLSHMSRTKAAQELGTVEFLDHRRLVAYPNYVQHRMGEIELVDESLPGHFDVLELWLVDPNYRLCSTRNVPPQRHDWWFDAVRRSQFDEQGKPQWSHALPNELLDNIQEHAADFPVSVEEAQRWRLERLRHELLCSRVMEACMDKYELDDSSEWVESDFDEDYMYDPGPEWDLDVEEY
ncbi:hypothetical protein QBC34DRAFT_358483 [Podospora aff. communis PSN243]|uniref:Uncharacterized protein n=1 Tax=Podospora aff. communis PSN243 TaxID=3040156 RepID=A0AAV9GBA1_9PEZI|nr:hypothetical protein QBC34DRAFT_358483 [Podospora aff. communis PSN243]